MSIDSKDVRRRCNAALAELRMPRPFDLAAFVRQISDMRGRDLTLVPTALPHGNACGLYAATDTEDFIFYSKHAPPLLRNQIILHELGHMVMGHTRNGLGVSDHTAAVLTPLIDPSMVRTMLSRGGPYDTRDEREAETFADLGAVKAGRWTVPEATRVLPAEVLAIVERLEGSLA